MQTYYYVQFVWTWTILILNLDAALGHFPFFWKPRISSLFYREALQEISRYIFEIFSVVDLHKKVTQWVNYISNSRIRSKSLFSTFPHFYHLTTTIQLHLLTMRKLYHIKRVFCTAKSNLCVILKLSEQYV